MTRNLFKSSNVAGGGVKGLIRKNPVHFIVAGFLFFSLVAAGLLLRRNIQTSLAATFGWLQTDWSGLASTTATANHSSNQTGWNKFFSKDAGVNVATPGQVTLTAASSTWVQTNTADFSAGTVSGTYATNGSVKLLKPFGATCTANTECNDGYNSTGGFCSGGICSNPWLSGPCGTTNLTVYYSDAAGTYTWGPVVTCPSPQCSGGVLVADNSVDFSGYPARNACKAIGGRLPTLSELACIYTNRTSYNTLGAFQASIYWSATEANANFAWNVYFSGGSQSSNGKTSGSYVRCIRGQ